MGSRGRPCGGEAAPWTLKAFSIREIDNQASIRPKHEEINTHPKCSWVFISCNASGPGAGLMAPGGVQA